MRKSFILATAVLLTVAGTAFAGPQPGQLAIGSSWVSHTPIGIRYWATNQFAIDAEIGFWLLDVPTGSGQKSSEFSGQIGFPINVLECSDVWFHIRPFVLFQSMSYENFGTTAIDSETDIYFGAALEMEAWLTECLSFSVWHGIVFNKYDVDDGMGGTTSRTDIHTEGVSLGNAGFHFYF